MPRNQAIVFRHRSRGFLGLGEEKVIEIRGIYLSHIDTLKKQGFDAQPATLNDLNNILKDYLGSRGDGRRFILIGIASPTGWEESAIEYVAEKYSLVFSDIVVTLVDLAEKKPIYPEKLSSIMPLDKYARIFIPEVPAEEEMHVENMIRDLCDEAYAKGTEGPVFLYKSLVKRAKEHIKGVSHLSIMRVLERYREKGFIEVKVINNEKVVECKSIR